MRSGPAKRCRGARHPFPVENSTRSEIVSTDFACSPHLRRGGTCAGLTGSQLGMPSGLF
jgi:hypothetical protein